MKNTTQKEIAKSLDINVRTVSRVLNGDPAVKESTRRRVIMALNRSGYYVQTHTHTENVVFDVGSGAFHRSQALALMQELSNKGFNFLITNHLQDWKLFRERIMDADIVVFCSCPRQEVIAETHEINPDILRINLFSNGVPGAEISIEPDNSAGGKLAAEHLYNYGHRDVMVPVVMSSCAVLERAKSFVGEMMLLHPDCRVIWHPFEAGDGLEQNITAFFREIPKLPSAIFCPNGYISYLTIRALNTLGIKVPETVSLLGFDLPEDIPNPLPQKLDTVYFRPAHIISLAEYYIVNRFILKEKCQVCVSSNMKLMINGSVKNLNDPVKIGKKG